MTSDQLAMLRATLEQDRIARAAGDRWARPVQIPVDEPLPDGRDLFNYGGIWYAVPHYWAPPEDPVDGIEVFSEEQAAVALGGGETGARVAAFCSALGSGDVEVARAIMHPSLDPIN